MGGCACCNPAIAESLSSELDFSLSNQQLVHADAQRVQVRGISHRVSQPDHQNRTSLLKIWHQCPSTRKQLPPSQALQSIRTIHKCPRKSFLCPQLGWPSPIPLWTSHMHTISSLNHPHRTPHTIYIGHRHPQRLRHLPHHSPVRQADL